MKNIFILLALCFSLLTSTSCQKDAWEEVELGKTPVLFLLNTTEKSSDEVYGFSVYYELNSLILCKRSILLVREKKSKNIAIHLLMRLSY